MAKKVNNQNKLIFVKGMKEEYTKNCKACGTRFRGRKEEDVCLSCAMMYEDGVFLDRDMGCGDK